MLVEHGHQHLFLLNATSCLERHIKNIIVKPGNDFFIMAEERSKDLSWHDDVLIKDKKVVKTFLQCLTAQVIMPFNEHCPDFIMVRKPFHCNAVLLELLCIHPVFRIVYHKKFTVSIGDASYSSKKLIQAIYILAAGNGADQDRWLCHGRAVHKGVNKHNLFISRRWQNCQGRGKDMRKKIKKTEDLGMLALFLIVLIVFGVYFLLHNPLKRASPDIRFLDEHKAAADAQAEKAVVAYKERIGFEDLTPLAVCAGFKAKADKLYDRLLSAKANYEDAQNPYYLESFAALQNAFDRSMEQYIRCIERR